MSIVTLGRYRIGQAIVWLAGEERRSGRVVSYLQEKDGTYTLWTSPDDGGRQVVVIEAQVIQAGADGATAPPQAVGAVDGAEARALAQAVLDGATVRRPIQQQLRLLALAVLGQPIAAGEVRS